MIPLPFYKVLPAIETGCVEDYDLLLVLVILRIAYITTAPTKKRTTSAFGPIISIKSPVVGSQHTVVEANHPTDDYNRLSYCRT